MRKTAVVLFNLGGPDSLEAVKPFLFNLFNDAAIIRLPQPFRVLIAKLISWRRAPIARDIYSQIGGKSPLLDQTLKQARALESKLQRLENIRVFTCMRYWNPRSLEVAREVYNYQPDRVILLPLYPQFSTTTSGSSIGDWMRVATRVGIEAKTKIICCYPVENGLVEAHTKLILQGINEIGDSEKLRVLFSAHGLPKKIVASGDPYQWQVEQTSAAIGKRLEEKIGKEVDWRICYQSRVGPLEWIGPSTDEEIVQAGKEECAVMVVPVAFVSEHSETLVELDIEYKELAIQNGVRGYYRVPAVGIDDYFVNGLANLVEEKISSEPIQPGGDIRECMDRHGSCFWRVNEKVY